MTALQDLLDRHVAAGTVPGAVALLADGPTVLIATAGRVALDGPAMRADAMMRIQSMTKPVTAVAALRLVEAGRIGLDDRVEPWLPELADRVVLTRPDAALDDTEPALRPITVRHLLTNESGYGMAIAESPLQEAMRANGTEAGADPPSLGADAWLARMGELPLAFQPGGGWRYHHSFGILGILISRITGRGLGDHLIEDLFEPLGMADTDLYVPTAQLDRLPAAYRHDPDGLVETEPAGGGFYAGPPPFDVSHGELVCTVQDYHRFARVLADGGRMATAEDSTSGRRLISAEHFALMTSDQIAPEHKTPESFVPGFWESMGWGFGLGVQRHGPHAGRFGWSGGQGTDFYVDPGGAVAVLATQVELGDALAPMIEEFQQVQP